MRRLRVHWLSNSEPVERCARMDHRYRPSHGPPRSTTPFVGAIFRPQFFAKGRIRFGLGRLTQLPGDDVVIIAVAHIRRRLMRQVGPGAGGDTTLVADRTRRRLDVTGPSRCGGRRTDAWPYRTSTS